MAVIGALATLLIACAGPPPSNGTDSSQCGPIVGVDEAERSDQFWEAQSNFGPTAFEYDTLAEMTADAHLIIRGRVIGTRDIEPLPVNDPGGELGARPITVGVVAIDEALKGMPNILEPGAVLVARLGSKELRAADFPRGEVVIFLKNYGRIREEFGRGLFNDPTDHFYYVRPNGYQAVLRNLGCIVRIVHSPDEGAGALDGFPGSLDGQPFDDLLDTIRQLVAAQVSSPARTERTADSWPSLLRPVNVH